MGPYPASKHALEAWSESLAEEVRPFSIRVALVQPSIIATPMLERLLASIDLTPGSPYAGASHSLHALFEEVMQTVYGPEQVAATIARAVSSADGRLSYPVGPGAERFVEA